MVKLLLGLAAVPSPHDAADALAVAICHLHSQVPARVGGAAMPASGRAARAGGTYPTRIRACADSTGQAAVVIAHLRGRIFEKHPNRLVLDVNGVGYDVFVPLSTFYGLGEPGLRPRCAFTRTSAKTRWCCTASRRCSSRSCSSG